MKKNYSLPGFLLGIVKPPGLLLFWTLALWLTNLSNVQSNTRSVGNKPLLVGRKDTIRITGMPGIPIYTHLPGYFLRSHKAYLPENSYALS
ncbi:MAG: hypothetical protein WC780_02055 [Lentimicrobiaceae bacterium]|jgi:hypothetical protein